MSTSLLLFVYLLQFSLKNPLIPDFMSLLLNQGWNRWAGYYQYVLVIIVYSHIRYRVGSIQIQKSLCILLILCQMFKVKLFD